MKTYSTKADPNVDPYTTWFIYGATGSGKTLAASTFPDPLLFVPRNESSQLSLRHVDLPFYVLGRKEGSPEGAPCKVRRQVSSLVAQLQKEAGEADAFLVEAWKAVDAGNEEASKELFAKAEEVFPYRTLVFESLTHLTDLIIEEIANAPGKTSGTMDQAKWGEVQTFYRNLHNALRGLPIHVVYTCLDHFDEKAGRGEPAISGSTSKKLPSACDVIGYSEETGGTYRIHFRSFKGYTARSRFTRLPKIVENFDFSTLHGKGLFKV